MVEQPVVQIRAMSPYNQKEKQMFAKDVPFVTQQITFTADGGARYVRINLSRKVLPRESNETVFVNTVTGKVRRADKGREVFAA
jgi:hypothetical protein